MVTDQDCIKVVAGSNPFNTEQSLTNPVGALLYSFCVKSALDGCSRSSMRSCTSYMAQTVLRGQTDRDQTRQGIGPSSMNW